LKILNLPPVSGLPIAQGKMTLANECAECKSLFEELSKATMGYYKILNQYQLVALKGDHESIEALDTQRREAQALRELARSAWHTHIAIHDDLFMPGKSYAAIP
jgi:hypothetical protein